MHISFTRHDPDISQSCKAVTEYLDKENSSREKEYEIFVEDFENQALTGFDEQVEQQNLFFSQGKDGEQVFLDQNSATDLIDANISSRAKERESKFFILNISPSKDELEHLNGIVVMELKAAGIGEKETQLLQQTDQGQKQLEIMRNDLMHQCLREYANDVMKDYAENFNRYVYNSPQNLPTQKEEQYINKETKTALAERGIDKKDPVYAEAYRETREKLAANLGRDLSVRKMTAKDMVWVAKVEEKRTYKGNDKWVIENRKIKREIKKLESAQHPDASKIEQLKSELHKDRATGEIVREGLKKGGQQYHIHVVVSRYDNCPNARYKGSISPLAHHRNSKMADKTAQVGFNRDTFFKKAERSFDQRFQYHRQYSYEKFNEQKKMRTGKKERIAKVSGKALSVLGQPVTKELYSKSGVEELHKLSLRNTVSRELGFRVPLTVPKTPLQLAAKTLRSIISKINDTSKGY
ncbi:DUF5712 family protein [Kaistella palustris]|uniref:DUF5712 family protein n=1 Tax=Kaistella palustris TaxID=493376 RepID=UPI00041D49B5|nr:DUF5712 family protein [Kaistella palustris]